MFYYSSRVQMCKLDHKEGWVLKYWCFWIVVLEKTPESPLDSKEIKLINLKGNQSQIFTGKTAPEFQYYGHLMWRADSQEKTSMPGKTEGWKRRREEKEDEMAGRHHRLNGLEFEQTLGDSEGQRSLERCSPKSQTQLSNGTTKFYPKYVLS